MSDFNDYHAFKSTSGGTGGGGGGCGTIIIVIVAVFLLFFISNGANWDAIDGLLGWGFLAYCVARFLFG